MTPFQQHVEGVARRYLGKREVPRGSNHSPEIDLMVEVGGGLEQPKLPLKGHPYCASYVCFSIKVATDETGGPGGPPQFKWPAASAWKLHERNAHLHLAEPPIDELCVGLIIHPDKTGHAVFVRPGRTPSGKLYTIEGNTGPGPDVPAKDREGDGFYERQDRVISDFTGGFLRIA